MFEGKLKVINLILDNTFNKTKHVYIVYIHVKWGRSSKIPTVFKRKYRLEGGQVCFLRYI